MVRPKLIHPVRIIIARFQKTDGVNKIWDDDFKEVERNKSISYDMTNLISLIGQEAEEEYQFYIKNKAGWETRQRTYFLVYTKDVVINNKFILDKGDKIIRIEEMQKLFTRECNLFIQSIATYGTYDKKYFIKLTCQNQDLNV